MSFELLDGSKLAETVRGEVRAEVQAFRARSGAPRGFTSCSWGRTRPARSTRGARRRLRTRSAWGAACTRSRRAPRRPSSSRSSRRSTTTTPSTASSCSFRSPGHRGALAVLDAIHPDKDVDGTHPSTPACSRPAARPRPVHTARLHAAHRQERRHPEGRPRGRRRTQQPRRQACGAAPARRGRDRHHCPLQDARPARRLPERRRPGRGGGRPPMVRGDWVKGGAVVIDVGINRVPLGGTGRQDAARGGRLLRRGEGAGERHHAGPQGGRADDHRVPAGEHAARGAATAGEGRRAVPCAPPPRRPRPA